MQIHAFPIEREVPVRLDWEALKDNGKEESYCVAELPCDSKFDHETKAGRWKNAKIEEKYGELGDVLN